jgi:hypothetical protein
VQGGHNLGRSRLADMIKRYRILRPKPSPRFFHCRLPKNNIFNNAKAYHFNALTRHCLLLCAREKSGIFYLLRIISHKSDRLSCMPKRKFERRKSSRPCSGNITLEFARMNEIMPA